MTLGPEVDEVDEDLDLGKEFVPTQLELPDLLLLEAGLNLD